MHNDAQNFAASAIAQAVEERPRETHDAGGLLQFLWDRTDSRQWSDQELEWLSSTCDNTELMALNLRKTLGGVAALVGWEIDNKGLRSGAFQPYDVPELLYGAADTLGIIEQMAAIGRDANFELRERYRNLAEQAGRALPQTPGAD